MGAPSSYIELHARSAFSFLRGASQPEALVERVAELGLPAIAVTDRDSHEQVRIVERGSERMGYAVAEFATLVDRAGSLGRAMTADTARERKLLEESFKAFRVLALVRVRELTAARNQRVRVLLKEEWRIAVRIAAHLDRVRRVKPGADLDR